MQALSLSYSTCTTQFFPRSFVTLNESHVQCTFKSQERVIQQSCTCDKIIMIVNHLWSISSFGIDEFQCIVWLNTYQFTISEQLYRLTNPQNIFPSLHASASCRVVTQPLHGSCPIEGPFISGGNFQITLIARLSIRHHSCWLAIQHLWYV